MTTTLDNWQFTLALTELRLDVVPNLAGAPLAKEGFVSAKATVTIGGDGRAPVRSGFVIMAVQIGCQVDLGSGLGVDIDPDVDLFDLNPGSAASIIDDDLALSAGPSVDADLYSGQITAVGLGTKELKRNTATIFVRDAPVRISACGGKVSVRIFASAKISTNNSDDSLNAYGPPGRSMRIYLRAVIRLVGALVLLLFLVAVPVTAAVILGSGSAIAADDCGNDGEDDDEDDDDDCDDGSTETSSTTTSDIDQWPPTSVAWPPVRIETTSPVPTPVVIPQPRPGETIAPGFVFEFQPPADAIVAPVSPSP